MESDGRYFRRRASEERTAALQARHPQARQAHLELAERYEDLVRGITAREQFRELSIVPELKIEEPAEPTTSCVDIPG